MQLEQQLQCIFQENLAIMYMESEGQCTNQWSYKNTEVWKVPV